jgi:gamma-glutamylcyclotransferase (GGCT)/AIG2-like uncharacterized protein YtfP
VTPVDPGRDSLFTYGTLLFPEVLTALIGRVPDRPEASCPGWRAAALPERVYPGLVAAERQTARGRLLVGLSGDEWHLLDAFEDPRYQLRPVAVTDAATVWAYVWTDLDDLTPRTWDRQHFARSHLPAYAARCANWSRRYRAAHGDSHPGPPGD